VGVFTKTLSFEFIDNQKAIILHNPCFYYCFFKKNALSNSQQDVYIL